MQTKPSMRMAPRCVSPGAVSGRRLSARTSDQFQEDFNCTVQYTSAWPWFPKFVAGGANNPPFDLTTWNQPELNKAAKAGRPRAASSACPCGSPGERAQ